MLKSAVGKKESESVIQSQTAEDGLRSFMTILNVDPNVMNDPKFQEGLTRQVLDGEPMSHWFEAPSLFSRQSVSPSKSV